MSNAKTRAAGHNGPCVAEFAVDLAFFVAEHDDHHLAIVTRLLAAARR